jgi:hypothetical protein
MSTGVQIVLVLHLLAALAFLLSVAIDLGYRLVRWIARQLFALWSDTLDGCAREVR